MMPFRNRFDRLISFRYVVSSLIFSAIVWLYPAHSEAKKDLDKASDSSGHWVVTNDKGSQVQLEVQQMPLAEVLQLVSKKTAVPIHFSVLPEGVVTATCVGPSLKPVLDCLLNHKADIIVRYADHDLEPANKDKIIEAWVLGSKFEASPGSSASCVMSQKSGSINLNYNEPAFENEVSFDQSDELLKIAKSGNASERADAISALLTIGRKDDPKVRAALEEALHDQDANVRSQALSSLLFRGDNREIVSSAIQEALHDSSVDVRAMAIDGITDEIGLLQQAINDNDEGIRDFAAMKLESLTKK